VLRTTLRWLWEHYGAPKLDGQIRRYAAPRPRNVTVTDEERATILAAARPHLRLWLLFCSDLAIRSGTAVRLAPEHYDPHRRKLTFTTKYGEKLTLPTTTEVEAMLDDCDMRNPTPFVRQLWAGTRGDPSPRTQQIRLLHSFRLLRLRLGIERRITPHDLRRTTAVAVYQHTRNVRKVQALLGHRNMNSTIWYLDHDLEPVEVELLETVKKPFIVHRSEKTA
jgi:integrase